MAAERCEVWWARRASARPQLLAALSDEERGRHARLRQPADRDRYLVGHSLLRILLGRRLELEPAEVVFATGEAKPRLAGPKPAHEFSLSHSGDRVVVAISAGTPLGIDLERVSAERDVGRLAEKVLDPRERSVLAGLAGPARQEAFHRYWVRKEAVVKATGHGLRVPLAAITVSEPGAPAELVSWNAEDLPPDGILLHDLEPGEGYVACLAWLGRSSLAIEEHDASTLLR